MHSPVLLVILDGFGHSTNTKNNAIYLAHTPYLNQWLHCYPHTYIHASGEYVGLPKNMVGNSEVGHLTIGSGRVIEQPLSRMNKLISNNALCSHPIIHTNLQKLAQSSQRLHIMGLISDGGVHGHIDHMIALLQCAFAHGIQYTYIHAFLDGRDTPPKSAAIYLTQLEQASKKYHASIASLHGRFFAMDRDTHWDRTYTSYKILTMPHQTHYISWHSALEHYYAQGCTDEFIPPTPLDPSGIIQSGDGIIFTNFRPDRARQLTACFIQRSITPHYNAYPVIHPSFVITPVVYANTLHTSSLLPTPMIHNTLKEVLSDAGKSVYAIAETEKYAHVTYFFNGQKEKAVVNEQRCLIRSLNASSYSTHPHMSAHYITQELLHTMKHNPKDFYLVNFANADMVGHSGNLNATIRAIECLDQQLGIIYEYFVMQMGGLMIITADHGKAENMFDDQEQQPNTTHTNNPVVFLCMKQLTSAIPTISGVTQLADIAPYILRAMNITVPKEMQRNTV